MAPDDPTENFQGLASFKNIYIFFNEFFFKRFSMKLCN